MRAIEYLDFSAACALPSPSSHPPYSHLDREDPHTAPAPYNAATTNSNHDSFPSHSHGSHSHSSGSSGNLAGTPMYMAPEVVRAGSAAPPRDVWAFGCVVLECATGKKPWGASLDNKG